MELSFVTDWPTDDVAADDWADALSSRIETAIDGLGLPYVFEGSVRIADLDGAAGDEHR